MYPGAPTGDPRRVLSQDKTGLLKTFLGSLPSHVAARLAMAVEMDRLMDGNVLPHDEILAGLRPALRTDQHERTPTPPRLFCRPFQDLLTSAPRRAKQKAAIARASVPPVWQWLCETLLPGEASAYVDDVKRLVLARKRGEAARRAAQFWPLAGAALSAALRDKQARKALGDDMVVADAGEMALLLSAGPAMEKLQALLPPPVPALNDALLWEVRSVYDVLVKDQPDVAPYVAVIAMNRLARPCEALRLALQVTRHSDDTLLSKTDMGLVGEILFSRMDTLKNSIQATRHPLFDAETLMEEVKNFAELSSGIVKEIELKRDGEWGKRLLAERGLIGKVMDGFMDRAPREVAAAMPLQRSSGPKTADFSRAPGPEKHAMALRYARLVAGSRNFAAAASFAAKQKSASEEISNELKRYTEDVLKELRSAGGERAVIAQGQFQLCTELTAMLFSEEEAEFVRRRGRSAQAAA